MDNTTDTRIAAIEKKVDEMHDIVMRLHRAQVRARNRKILYWALVIGLGIFSYYSVKPYLEQLQSIYTMTQHASSSYGELLNLFSQKP